MSKIILYGVEVSPPVRAVKMTLEALKLDYEFKLINLQNGENLSEEFKRKNPQHTVPLLEDEGKYIWESHAIMAYLVAKYAKNDELYPKEPLLRAKVDQRLHFESGVLFQGCLRNICLPVFYRNQNNVPREKIEGIYEAYDFLEAFLGNDNNYICGNNLTIADFSIVSTVSSLIGLAPIEAGKYVKLQAWFERMTSLPNYQQNNGNGAQMLISELTKRAKIV